MTIHIHMIVFNGLRYNTGSVLNIVMTWDKESI